MFNQSLRVVLFVGHKGPGTGAACAGLDEYELAQKAACAIGCDLMLRGHQPFVVTGEGTDYIEQRARLAEACKPDLAIACHFNAHEDTRAHGCELLYHPEDMGGYGFCLACATLLASKTGVHLRHGNDGGCAPRSGLLILKYMHTAGIPIGYLEPLFLTNEYDRTRLVEAGYFRKFAAAVVDAVEIWGATCRGTVK